MKNSCLDEYLTPDGLKNLECLAREYRQNYILARVMGIETITLYNWRKKYKAIKDAFDRGRATQRIYFTEVFDTKPKYEKWLTPSGLIDLEELAYNCGGITALQAKLGIGQSTMHRWREHIEIDEAIERGLARANKKVEPLSVLIEKPKVLEDMLAWCDPVGVMA